MLTSKGALRKLKQGNQRYVLAQQEHPNQSPDRRRKLLKGQKPFAVILSCSDSRVPPEIIFDQGLGDLFVVRVAGNIVDDVVLGSIEYAAEHLPVSLVMVLGHSQCGAVTATLQGKASTGHLPSIAAAIQPAMKDIEPGSHDLVEQVSKANAKRVAEQLASAAPILAHLVEAGKIQVVAAYYDLQTGQVEILP